MVIRSLWARPEGDLNIEVPVIILIYLQVKPVVFFTYSRYIGLMTAIAIVVCYLGASGTSVGSNFWLSEWSSDAHINGTMAASRRDLRLGVYGALGFAQG